MAEAERPRVLVGPWATIRRALADMGLAIDVIYQTRKELLVMEEYGLADRLKEALKLLGDDRV